MCSLTIECVLLLYNVFSYYRMCSLTVECFLLGADRMLSARSERERAEREPSLYASREGGA